MKTHIFKCFVSVGSAEVDGGVKEGVRGGAGWGSAGFLPFTKDNRLHYIFVKRRGGGKRKGEGKKGLGYLSGTISRSSPSSASPVFSSTSSFNTSNAFLMARLIPTVMNASTVLTMSSSDLFKSSFR